MGVEVLLLQHHGVLVTIEQLHAFRLVGSRKTQAVGHLRLASGTALGLDFDNTIGTLRTPDGRCGSILQHGDALDVLRVDVQQLSKLLVIGRGEVEVLGAATRLPDVTVDDDKRLAASVDTRHTTQTHRSTRTQVTRVGHDVKTGDTSLQGFVDRRDGQSLEFLHVDGLTGGGYFLLRNGKATALSTFPGGDGHLLDLGGVFQLHNEFRLVKRKGHRFVSHIRDTQFVLRILQLEREVTAHVCLSGGHDTVGSIKLHHIGQHHRAEVVGHRSADDVAGLLRKGIDN